MQIDGHTGDNRLTNPSRKGGAPLRVAQCRAHAVEADIGGVSPGQRLFARQARTAPLLTAFGDRLQAQRRKISDTSRLGEKLTYVHNHWHGLQTFLTDGRVEIDSNRVKNLNRPFVLHHPNALFAGHDKGGIA